MLPNPSSDLGSCCAFLFPRMRRCTESIQGRLANDIELHISLPRLHTLIYQNGRQERCLQGCEYRAIPTLPEGEGFVEEWKSLLRIMRCRGTWDDGWR